MAPFAPVGEAAVPIADPSGAVPAPLPADESVRLAELDAYSILDTPPEHDFDDMARLASEICGTPIALVSLVDQRRQWFKARVGLEAPETPRELAFCAHAILGRDLFVVADAARDSRFANNPLVRGDPRIRFYAGAPLQAPGGHGLGTLCVIDRVPRKLTPGQEGALSALARQIMAHLELRRTVRQLEETQADLRRAKCVAESASRAKADFVASMSHEIRTPMNGVLGMTRLALGCELPPAAREYVGAALSSAESLLTVVNDVLDFSKIEAGKVAIDPRPFSPRTLLSEVARMFATPAHDKGLSLTHHTAADVPATIVADPDRLRQVLVNLVGNALKFTSTGGVTIDLTQSRATAGTLEFAVRDTGIGIPADRLTAVFSRFEQADELTARRFGGTGLGLAISAKLVDLMGGRLCVDSTLGTGSEFRFTLPVREASPSQAIAESPACAKPLARPLNILVAEDHPVNRLLATRLLERDGHTVTIAENGQKAVQACEEGSFDLVLMDVQMPVMDGLEATRILRQRGTATPIFATTASAMSEDREKCRAAGMNGFVCKPFNMDELFGVLAEVGKLRP